MRGFDHEFMVPHSRHTTVSEEDIVRHDKLRLISTSEEAGLYIAMSKDDKQIFVTGHSEYDPETLKQEYERDKARGMDPKHPTLISRMMMTQKNRNPRGSRMPIYSIQTG